MLYAELLRNLSRFAFQRQRRPPALFPHHFQVHPAHSASPARTQRLHRRFFCRKPPRIPLILVLEPLAVFSFSWRINAFQKDFPMALDRPLDALYFSNVHPHSNDQDSSSSPAFAPAADSDYTDILLANTKTITAQRDVPNHANRAA